MIFPIKKRVKSNIIVYEVYTEQNHAKRLLTCLMFIILYT